MLGIVGEKQGSMVHYRINPELKMFENKSFYSILNFKAFLEP